MYSALCAKCAKLAIVYTAMSSQTARGNAEETLCDMEGGGIRFAA